MSEGKSDVDVTRPVLYVDEPSLPPLRETEGWSIEELESYIPSYHGPSLVHCSWTWWVSVRPELRDQLDRKPNERDIIRSLIFYPHHRFYQDSLTTSLRVSLDTRTSYERKRRELEPGRLSKVHQIKFLYISRL